MHGHVEYEVFLYGISGFLGAYYLTLALINAVAAFYLWQSGKARTICNLPFLRLPFTTAHLWLVVAVFFTIISPLAMSGNKDVMSLVSFPQWMRTLVNDYTGPVVYSVGTFVALMVLYLFRRFFVKPNVAWGMLNLTLLAMGLAMVDQNFAAIVAKPDNVPIVGLVYLLGFFTWLGAYKAVQNDERMNNGEEPLEKLDNEKVLVWPDLVYTELICMIAITALLIFWAIALQAPLEEPASAVKTPNPSKAPWYFLGLQEMLVYYDPWMAGVVLPSLVIFGLAAIPFLDFNKEGSGYYTIERRRFAYLTFQFGFLVLWVTLIVLGTFLRGPNWYFYGPFEEWDPHKVVAASNVDLSDYFWVSMLDQPKPKAPDGAGTLSQLGYILVRESPGFILLLGYFIIIPPMLAIMNFRPLGFLKGPGEALSNGRSGLAKTMGGAFRELSSFTIGFRKIFVKMGFIRYMVMVMLLLTMALLPIKMVARWTINLKYFISIPEYFLNF